MIRILVISCCLMSLIVSESFCQKKRRKDFFNFKTSKIESNYNYDTINVVDEDWFEISDAYLDSLAWEEDNWLEEQMRLAADTDQLVLAYNVPVEVSEQLLIDSVWVTLREYYSVWSSYSVNPYDVDGVKFDDTLAIPLVYEKPNLSYALPLNKMTVTSPFGLRRWKWHYGDDLRLTVGDSVVSAFDGIVRVAHYDRYGYGHYVLVRHYNGLETLYGHLKKSTVKVGDKVKAGELVGWGGSSGRSSGPHLHFEVRYEGNAIDPKTMFDFDGMKLWGEEYIVTAETFSYLKEARKIRYHRVRSGDTLSGIGYRYGISITKICRLNGISRKSILRIGQRLRIT